MTDSRYPCRVGDWDDLQSSPAPRKPNRFIAVFHSWFVSSKGFKVVELDAPDRATAEAQADAIAYRTGGTFRETAYHIIELQDGEIPVRKLTWMERITGRLHKPA